MTTRKHSAGILAILALAGTVARSAAQEPPCAAPQTERREAARPPAGDQVKAIEAPALSVTRHSIDVAGRRLAYTATAGLMPLRNETGETEAEIFYIAYTLDGDH